MANNKKNEETNIFFEEDESIGINRRMDALEREQEQEQQRDKEYKDRQLKFNKFLTLFTGGLLVVSVVAGCISLY